MKKITPISSSLKNHHQSQHINKGKDPNYALILSAGLGTRMGCIGEKLPKTLWPIFEKPLIEVYRLLLTKYFPQLQNNIYCNLFYKFDSFIEYFTKRILQSTKNSTEIEIPYFLLENKLLDVGGSVHNFARLPHINRKGTLLICNGDHLVFFSQSIVEKFTSSFSSNHYVLLLSKKVKKSSGLNELVLNENGELVEIIKNDKIEDEDRLYITYTGVGLINLEKVALYKEDEVLSFFESVANFKKFPVNVYTHNEKILDLDFGTSNRYLSSIEFILNQYECTKKQLRDIDSNVELPIDFLLDENIFIPENLKFHNNQKIYSSTANFHLDFNFSNFLLQNKETEEKLPQIKNENTFHIETFSINGGEVKVAEIYYKGSKIRLN
jgi:NDP-sugar pyrophosphorylase family protein